MHPFLVFVRNIIIFIPAVITLLTSVTILAFFYGPRGDNLRFKFFVRIVGFLILVLLLYTASLFLFSHKYPREFLFVINETPESVQLALEKKNRKVRQEKRRLKEIDERAKKEREKEKDKKLEDKKPKDKKPKDKKPKDNRPKQSGDGTFRVLEGKNIKTSFADVIGLEYAKESVKDFILSVKKPERFTKLGIKSPKAILFHGPPGNGKTLMARALAGESGLNIIATSGSSFVERWVGVGALRVRELFSLARKNKPCLIFIDEFEVLVPNREVMPNVHGNSEYHSTVNQMLSELDGFDESSNNGVYLLAATNHLQNIDAAVVRSGRFHNKIYIGQPTNKERAQILKHHLKKLPVDPHLNIEKIIKKLDKNSSRADIATIVQEAGLEAVRAGDKMLRDRHFKKDKSLKQSGGDTFRVLEGKNIKTSFADVIGLEYAKESVKDFILSVKKPERFTKLGIKSPKAILFHGPPGNGKTLMARALAGESGLNIIATSGSSFVERWVGVGALRVRELFSLARKNKPCLIFIDEFEVLVPNREVMPNVHGNSEYHSTVNQMLSELDGFDESSNNGVYLLAATNHLQNIDAAVVRSGRFHNKIYIGQPTNKERAQILKHHLKKLPVDPHLNIEKIIKKLDKNSSRADIATIVQKAGLEAVRTGDEMVRDRHFEKVLNSWNTPRLDDKPTEYQ